MGSSAASNAIKNGILFGLVILIIHVAIRNVLVEDEHGQGKQQNQQQQIQKRQKGTCLVRMAETEAFRAADDADGDADDAAGQEAAAAAAAAAPPARPAARSNRRSEAAAAPGAAEDLMSYVFGSEAASAAGSAGSSGSGGMRGASASAVAAASCLSAPPKFAPAVADGCGKSALMTAADESNGWMVVGKYSNENVMCGGKIEVAGRALDGYDGSSATFSALAPL